MMRQKTSPFRADRRDDVLGQFGVLADADDRSGISGTAFEPPPLSTPGRHRPVIHGLDGNCPRLA